MTSVSSTASATTFPRLIPSEADLKLAYGAIHNARVPQIPDLVLALRDELARDEPNFGRAAELISQDPVMAGQVLKTINSPFFFCPTKIASIQRAVTLMGLTRLTNLVTAEAISRMLEVGEGGSRTVWNAMMERATLTSSLARLVDGVEADEAYLFAIMQDVGALIFAELLPDYGAEWLLRGTAAPRSLMDYERGVLGVDHATVGFLLAGTWRLPEHLALAIYHHHSADTARIEDRRTRVLVAMSKLAGYLMGLTRGSQDSSELQDDWECALDELNLSDADWLELREQALQSQH